MDYYDPAEHTPIWVDADPLPVKKRESSWEIRKRRARSHELLHSKEAWMADWQTKMLSLLREPE